MGGAANRAVTIVIDQLGRPPTTNKHRTVHYRVRAATDAQWREAGCVLTRQLRAEPMRSVTVVCHGRYPDRRALPDCDALHPALKAVLDGVVDAGLLADDRPPFVRSIMYLEPVVARGLPAALVVTLTESGPLSEVPDQKGPTDGRD